MIFKKKKRNRNKGNPMIRVNWSEQEAMQVKVHMTLGCVLNLDVLGLPNATDESTREVEEFKSLQEDGAVY